VQILGLSGQFQRPNASFKMQGAYAAALEADEQLGLEVIQVNGVTYLRWPRSSGSIIAYRWYAITQAIPLPSDPAAAASVDSPDLLGVRSNGVEALDGQQCAISTASGPRAALRMTRKLISEGETTKDEVLGVSNSSFKFWTCADGYVHQIQMAFDYNCTCQQTRQISFNPAAVAPPQVSVELQLHYSAFSGRFVIAAPENALPFDNTLSTYQPLTANVYNGGNIRQQPNLHSRVLGQLHAGQVVQLQLKSADGRWYYVAAPEATGWVSATLLTIDPRIAAQVPIAVDQSPPATPQPAPSSALTATVFNGGNVRAAPNRQGQVLDQIHAGETVRLLKKTAGGEWYAITNPRGVTGWVHVSLLTISRATAAQVPVGK
jgi:SH3-like domain-containing protein